MAKFSQKVMGKEIGDAKVYAEPHTMTGGPVDMKAVVNKKPDRNTLAANQVGCSTPAMRVSAGDPGRDNVKTSGMKIRGTGAAIKGLLARGPMA